MLLENINLVDNDDKVVKTFDNIKRRLKLRKSSHSIISDTWKKIRLNRLNKSLENKKENLVNIEFSSSEMKASKGEESIAEKEILKKTTAIARLEGKINFLKTGKNPKKKVIESRAIKLRQKMMENIKKNIGDIYSIIDPENKMNEIFNEKNDTLDGTKPYSINPKKPINNDEKIKENIKSEDVKKAVDKSFEVQEKTINKESIEKIVNSHINDVSNEKHISKDTIREEIAKNMEAVAEETEPVIDKDKISTSIKNEFEKMKVKKNGTSIAKINKFINDDGTYSLKREDMDEAFRITKIDGSEYIPEEDSNKKKDEKDSNKAYTTNSDINDDIFGNSTIEEQVIENNNEKISPIIVPEREEYEEPKFEFESIQENDENGLAEISDDNFVSEEEYEETTDITKEYNEIDNDEVVEEKVSNNSYYDLQERINRLVQLRNQGKKSSEKVEKANQDLVDISQARSEKQAELDKLIEKEELFVAQKEKEIMDKQAEYNAIEKEINDINDVMKLYTTEVAIIPESKRRGK